MKVNVYFKNYHLGSLQEVQGKMVYTSNLEGEKQFSENSFSSSFYILYDSNQKVLESLPNFLQDYLNLAQNDFFISQTNIQEHDSAFTKLFKLSALAFDDIGFYISQK